MKHLVPSSIGKISFSFKKSTWFYLVCTSTLFIDFSSISLPTIILTFVFTLITISLGHSIGLHRGIIHKSYQTSKFTRNLLLYFFVYSGLGSPLNWLKSHYYRDYWQNREDCPKYFAYRHSLIIDYWWYLHLNFTPTSDKVYNIPKSDLNDPWIQWLHKTWVFHIITGAIVVYLFSDLNTVLLLFPLRIAITHLGHWYIGYASHKYGYSKYHIEHANESGYNDVVLGLISFGEGLHNNHHGHPSSAKFSHNWYEIDISWYFIVLLEKAGVIWKVKRPTSQETLKSSARVLRKSKWIIPSFSMFYKNKKRPI